MVVFSLIFTTMDGRISLDRLINPIGYGVMTFFAFGGVATLSRDDDARANLPHAHLTAHRWAVRHPLRYALPAAVCAGVLLFALRLIALATGSAGPWSGVDESALDMAFRGTVVYLIIAGTGLVVQRSDVFR